MDNYKSDDYDSSIFINFVFGVGYTSFSDTVNDIHISHWEDKNAGSWCYVEHDSTGDYYGPVAMGDVESLGLRIDFPVTAKWSVQRMKKAAKSRGFKGYSKMKKAELLAMLTYVAPTEVEQLGTEAAKTALDQVETHGSLADAVDAYFLNLSDTLTELGKVDEYPAAYKAFEAVLVAEGVNYRPHGLWHSVAPGVTEDSIVSEMVVELAALPKCKDGSVNGNKRHGLETRYVNRLVKECGLGRNEAGVVVHSRTCWHENLRTDEYIAQRRKEMKEYDNKLRMRAL
jgi:hypothetical protein